MKTIIYMDGAYLAAVLRDQFSSERIDFYHFAERISDKNFLRVNYYNCIPEIRSSATESEKLRVEKSLSFFNALKKMPRYTLRLGSMEYRGIDPVTTKPIFVQKRVDTLMATDMLVHAFEKSVERQILVTGDSDFVPVIEEVKRRGIEIGLVHGNNTHSELIDVVDWRTPLTPGYIKRVRQKTLHGK